MSENRVNRDEKINEFYDYLQLRITNGFVLVGDEFIILN